MTRRWFHRHVWEEVAATFYPSPYAGRSYRLTGFLTAGDILQYEVGTTRMRERCTVEGCTKTRVREYCGECLPKGHIWTTP